MADDVVGWVPAPTERGTLTLIWSCVVTIFACTWTVLHLNVPGREDTSLTIALRKTKWMAINIVFPEFIFSKAVCDLRLALQELHELDKSLKYDNKTIEWTTHHKTSSLGDFLAIKWSWEAEYPDGWYGLIYDLLRLERPPHLRRTSAGQVLSNVFSFGRLSRKFTIPDFSSTSTSPEDSSIDLEAIPSSSSQPNLQNKAEGPEDRQSRRGLATEDHGQTGAEQRQPESIHDISSPQGIRGDSRKVNAQDSVGNSKRDEQARPDVGTSESAASQDDGQSMGSANSPLSEQDPVPQTTQSNRTCTRTVSQKWTIVHSYYAQMGGLVFCDDLKQNTMTAFNLAHRFMWDCDNTMHPIMHLVLGKNDILDKSKADWLLKGLAVLQVTWIIINVIVRHITRLPISHIEIATVAFAFMAISTYVANWWKPKDISQPTMLQFGVQGYQPVIWRDKKQSFTQRFWHPMRLIEEARTGTKTYVSRMANDIVWLEGDKPLLFYLMAGSSLIFGGIHCLAWDFDLPTRAELICWRVASLASAVLPVVALAIANLGPPVVSHCWEHYHRPKLSKELSLDSSINYIPLFMKPTFSCWSADAQNTICMMPKELRNWEVEPTADVMERWGTDGRLSKFTRELSHAYDPFEAVLAGFCGHWRWIYLAQKARDVQRMLTHEVLEFWRDYEDFVRSKQPHLRPPVGPVTSTYLEHILEVLEKVSTEAVMFRRLAERVTYFVSIANFILYTAARLVILALLFTSLRAAPAGLYQDTVWSRFLPKIS